MEPKGRGVLDAPLARGMNNRSEQRRLVSTRELRLPPPEQPIDQPSIQSRSGFRPRIRLGRRC